jgi:predicted ribosomally synthesized six-cysteine peptide SCIFF
MDAYVVKFYKEILTRSRFTMKRIKTIETRDLKKSVKTGGCGECQTSCQSACKTSCGVANQQCENVESK